MMDITDLSASLTGTITPFLVHIVRLYFLKCSGKAALWLSLLTAGLCTTMAYYIIDDTFTAKELLSNIGVAFSISQVVYRQIQDKLPGTDNE